MPFLITGMKANGQRVFPTQPRSLKIKVCEIVLPERQTNDSVIDGQIHLKIINFPDELKMRQVILINWVFCYSFAIEIRRNNEMVGEGVTEKLGCEEPQTQQALPKRRQILHVPLEFRRLEHKTPQPGGGGRSLTLVAMALLRDYQKRHVN